jgi:hypothetical protein
MPAFYRIHDGYIHITLEGTLTDDQLSKTQRLLFSDPSFVGNLPRLVDGRRISDMSAVTPATVRAMAEAAIARGLNRVALIADDDVALVLMRLYQGCVYPAKCLVTRDSDEALRFLGLL